MPEFKHHEQSEQARVRRREQTQQAQPTHPLNTLQSQVGNAQIARMLAQRQPSEEEEMVQASRDIQRTEDEEELQLMRSVEGDVQRAEDEEELQLMRSVEGDVQRAEDEEELQLMRSVEGHVQRAAEVGLEGGPVGDETASKIQAMRGGGSALDAGTRTSMESAFETDFSDVRIHSGGESNALNEQLGARAFTTGSDIFLGSGASSGDQHLMAHELTHVVQQRSMSPSGPMRVTSADDATEGEAEAMARNVTSHAGKANQ